MSINFQTRRRKPGRRVASPVTHRYEFPARYSLVGCSPAEPTSAFLTKLILISTFRSSRAKLGERLTVQSGRVSNSGALHSRRLIYLICVHLRLNSLLDMCTTMHNRFVFTSPYPRANRLCDNRVQMLPPILAYIGPGAGFAFLGGFIGTKLGWGTVAAGEFDFRSVALATFGP